MTMVKLKKINAPTCTKCDNKQPLKSKGGVRVTTGGLITATYQHYCGKCKHIFWLERKYPAYVNVKDPNEYWHSQDFPPNTSS